MNFLDAVILGILQGVTEFLPISSSGHLIIGEKLMKLNPETLKQFDIAIHFGTLLAILIYFRKDILNLIASFVLFCKEILAKYNLVDKFQLNDAQKKNKKLLGYLIVGTVPAIIVGALFSDKIDEIFRDYKVVAVVLILVAFAFLLTEWFSKKLEKSEITGKKALLIGAIQTFAFIPGVSRSGSTISAGLLSGLKREEAARFSFLLGSIAIAAATTLSVFKVVKGTATLPPVSITATGVLFSFIAGYFSIAFLMKYLKKHSLNIFAVYRILFGLIVLFIL